MAYLDDLLYDKENDFYYIDNYSPYSHGQQSSFSRNILRLKQQEPDAITFFYDLLSDIIEPDDNVVCVPSSREYQVSSFTYLVQGLLDEDHDFTTLLMRTSTIDKLAYGGKRDYDVHINSIQMNPDYNYIPDSVILLDDVSTSGNSLRACEDILYEAGVQNIIKLVLGKTA